MPYLPVLLSDANPMVTSKIREAPYTCSRSSERRWAPIVSAGHTPGTDCRGAPRDQATVEACAEVVSRISARHATQPSRIVACQFESSPDKCCSEATGLPKDEDPEESFSRLECRVAEGTIELPPPVSGEKS